jgi:WD40 repeat protein
MRRRRRDRSHTERAHQLRDKRCLSGTQFTCFTGTKVHRLMRSVAFQPPHGSLLATSSVDCTIRQFTCFTGTKVHRLMRSVAFQPPHGSLLATSSVDCTIRQFTCFTGTKVHRLMRSVAFQPPHGSLLATSSVDCTIRVWRFSDGSCLRVLGERSRAKVYTSSVRPQTLIA